LRQTNAAQQQHNAARQLTTVTGALASLGLLSPLNVTVAMLVKVPTVLPVAVNRISWGVEIVPKLHRSVCCVNVSRPLVTLPETPPLLPLLPRLRLMALKMSSIAELPLRLGLGCLAGDFLVAALARRWEESVHLPAGSHAMHQQQLRDFIQAGTQRKSTSLIRIQAGQAGNVRSCAHSPSLLCMLLAGVTQHLPSNVVSSFVFVSCAGIGSVTITFSTSPPTGVTTIVNVKTVPDSPLDGDADLVIVRSLLLFPLITCENMHTSRGVWHTAVEPAAEQHDAELLLCSSQCKHSGMIQLFMPALRHHGAHGYCCTSAAAAAGA
jgi:hypothetical protein